MNIKPTKHHIYFRHRLSMPQETLSTQMSLEVPVIPFTWYCQAVCAFLVGHLSLVSCFLIGLEAKFLSLHELYLESEVSLLALICPSPDGIINSMEQTLGDSEGQGSLACCSLRGRRVGCNLATEQEQPLHGQTVTLIHLFVNQIFLYYINITFKI